MARYTGPKVRLSRREGVRLQAKADKVMARRNYIPGQHGPTARGRKLTNYGTQLREKQKAKRLYGLMEKQFKKYYDEAVRLTGNSSENLIKVLEKRLDNVVYRLGFATTRDQARQLVSHGHITVDGKKVDIASFAVKIGMVISVKNNKTSKNYWLNLKEKIANSKNSWSWLDINLNNWSGKITSEPTLEEVAPLFDPKLIIEFYSR